MKVLIADDHMVVREGLKQILKNLSSSYEIEEAKDGIDALHKIKTGDFNFVILDISMPGLSGLEILKTIKDHNNKVNILILSFHPQEQYAIRALRMGASGYLSKDSAPEELANAIKKISAGEKYISSDIIGKLLNGINEPDDIAIHDCLSEREFQILCLLAKGLSIIEIGKHLFISEKTVSTYRTRLLEKMGMKSNTELALYAYKNNLIE